MVIFEGVCKDSLKNYAVKLKEVLTKLVTEYVLKSVTEEPESDQGLPTSSFPLGFLLPQLSTFVSEDHNGISTLLISY